MRAWLHKAERCLQGSRNRTYPASQQEPPGRPERRASGPRWGLRGKEDLGDGLHAVFQLESGFDSRNGRSLQGGRLFGRQATVGLLNARWGELRLGRQYNAATRYFLDMLGPAFGGFSLLHTGYGLGMTSASFPRYDNQIFYQTPSMGGIKAAAGYAFSVNDTRNAETGYATANNTRAITAALQYARGPLSAFLGYDQLNASRLLSAAQAAAAPRLHHRRLIRFHRAEDRSGLQPRGRRLVRRQELSRRRPRGWIGRHPDVCVFQGLRSIPMSSRSPFRRACRDMRSLHGSALTSTPHD